MGFSKLEILGQIASFERRLRGAAPTPLALPYHINIGWLAFPGKFSGLSSRKNNPRGFIVQRNIRLSSGDQTPREFYRGKILAGRVFMQ